MKGAMTIFRNTRINEFAAAFRTCYRKYCTTENYTTTKEKEVHPYCRIHPWKSKDEFANDLLKNIVYNKDGIIAINKPYGIPVLPDKGLHQTSPNVRKQAHKIVGALDYTVADAFPYLKSELNVPDLIPFVGSEMYMSGVYVFGINEEIIKQLNIARHRTQGKYRKYWVITIRVPNEIKGKYRLAMTLKKSVLGEKKPVMLTQWSNNAVKRNEVKIMNIEHKVLTNSTQNLSSLIEIQASARKWNGIKLFTSTMLYAPILGDNIHGSRVQEIMGTWLKVDPFADSCWDLPKVNRQLLDLLNIAPSKQEIIPAHIHLRCVYLIYGREQKDIIIEAPLIDPFYWTCKQLKFKLPDEVEDSATDNVEELASIKYT